MLSVLLALELLELCARRRRNLTFESRYLCARTECDVWSLLVIKACLLNVTRWCEFRNLELASVCVFVDVILVLVHELDLR